MVWPGKHGMVYDIALRAWHGLCSGLVGMAWYMVLLGEPGMVYVMYLQAWHGIWYCLARHGIAYGVAWQDDMHMVCIWYGLSGMAWYMVWSIGYVMTYDVVRRAWHGN